MHPLTSSNPEASQGPACYPTGRIYYSLILQIFIERLLCAPCAKWRKTEVDDTNPVPAFSDLTV